VDGDVRRPVICLAGCKRRPSPDDLAPEPVASAAPLPPLVVKDDTPDLLLTWVDAKGDAHTADKPADVPLEGRDQVRVVVTTRDEGNGNAFYVTNLMNKNVDETYPVATVSRAEWDGMILKRRLAARPQQAPQEPPGAAAGAPPSAPPPAKGTVIVYGAQWCDACHQAMAFFKQRGIPAIEKDIENDPGAEQEMRAKLSRAGFRGSSSIPIIDVGGRIFIGFDPQGIETALRKHGAAL
jgi:glutaredoxin